MDNLQKAKEHFLEGIRRLENGAFEEAEREFVASLELAPDRVSTLTNLGATQVKLKKYLEARATCEKAISLDKNNPEALLNLGLVHKEAKDFGIALDYFDKATKLDPGFAKAWSNKGSAFHDLRQYQSALRSFDEALRLDQNYYEAWSNKGLTLYDLKRYKESHSSHEKAISINNQYADAWFNKGLTYIALKEHVDALICFRTAHEINPHHKYLLGDMVHTQLIIGDWDNLEEKILALSKEIDCGQNASTPFPMLSAMDKPQLHLETAKLWINDKFPSNYSLPAIPKRRHSKIRIGYFSPDFKDHPVSFLTAELFELHDRNQFEVFAFSLQPADSNNLIHKRLVAGFDRFIEVENNSDQEIAQLAKDHEIDIAIDLCGHTQFARTGIFSYRAAPIQVNYLGYPGTLGADYFDYILADPTLIPKSNQQFYSEKIAYLPHSYMVDDSKRLPSGRSFSKAELDIPENKFIFCCFNNSYKLNEATLDSWAKIISKTPNSVLWLSENNVEFRNNLLKSFAKRGIDPNQIIFAGRLESMGDHLARYQIADLFLDTLPFNAHTTAIDALKAGVPLLTLTGRAFAGRVGASLLQAINLPELITHSREEYESLAIRLATQPERLELIKKKLALNIDKSPLFNTKLYTSHIELTYIEMYERYKADLPPEHLFVTTS